jgi:DNA-binding MarR family transcriptional regulator
MTELARELGMPVTTAADFVRAMRERGHVRRTPHPTDSRSHLLTLTAAGLRTHRKASLAFARAHDAFLDALADSGLDEDHARELLDRLGTAARTGWDAIRPATRAGRG